MNKVLNATKWSVISEVIAKIISPITTMVLARILSTEVFGIVASITAITSLADLLTDAGFNAYIIQHQFEDEKEKENTFNVCFWSNFIISCFLYAIIFINRRLFSSLVGASGYEMALIVAALILPLTSVSSIEQAIMKKELIFKKVGIIKVVSKLVPFITTIPLALLSMEYWSLILGILIGEIVNVVLCMKLGGFFPKVYFSFERLKVIFSFSIWAFLESILEWLIANIAILTLGTIFGIYYLGVFKTGINIISQITTSVYALYSNVYKSAIAKEQANPESFKNMLYNFQKYTSIFSIPLGVGALLYRNLLTNILLGSKWGDATLLIGLWGITSMLSIAFGNFYSDAIRAKGYPRKLVVIDLVYLAVIIIILLNANHLDFQAFCIYFALAKVTQPILQIIVGMKTFDAPFLKVIKNSLPQIIAASVMTVMILFFGFNNMNMKIQIVSIVLCIVVYFLVLLCVHPERKELISWVKTIIAHKRRNKMNHKRNLYIDGLRFLFASIVFFYHFRSYAGEENQIWYFKGGYLGVEFFFLVAGYYLVEGEFFDKTKTVSVQSAFKKIKGYIVSRYKKLYPEYIISILLMIAVSFVTVKEYRTFQEYVSIIPDILCVQVLFNGAHVNSLLWFVSSLIWGSVLIKLVLYSKKKHSAYIGLTVISIITIAIFAVFIGHLDINQNKWFYFDGLVRGCVEMLIGSTINIAVKKIRESGTKLNSKALIISFYLNLVTICAYMLGGGYTRGDFLVLILLYFLIMCAELISYETENKKTYTIVVWFGTISYSLYLNQVLIQKVIHSIMPGRNYWLMAFVSLFFDLFFSTVVYMFISFARNQLFKSVRENRKWN